MITVAPDVERREGDRKLQSGRLSARLPDELKMPGLGNGRVNAVATASATHDAGVAGARHVALSLRNFSTLIAVIHPAEALTTELEPKETEPKAQIVAKLGSHFAATSPNGCACRQAWVGGAI